MIQAHLEYTHTSLLTPTDNSVQGSDNWVAYFNNPGVDAIGGINSAYTVGAIIGGFFFGGPVSDFFGRRVGMAVGCVLVIIATFIQAFVPRGSLIGFLIGRTIIGFGQGIALTSGPIYIGELAPPHIRGKIMAFWQLFYSVGSFICFWVAFACTKYRNSIPGEWDWKIIVMFQILVPAIILALLPTLPDTPRWSVSFSFSYHTPILISPGIFESTRTQTKPAPPYHASETRKKRWRKSCWRSEPHSNLKKKSPLHTLLSGKIDPSASDFYSPLSSTLVNKSLVKARSIRTAPRSTSQCSHLARQSRSSMLSTLHSEYSLH